MKELIKIKTALLSVFEKKDILQLASFLQKNDIRILSTGGTFKLLKANNIAAIEISDLTGFPEIMDGRLKTLHPKIHGGLLGREKDKEIMEENGIFKIDLVVINLYPFEETAILQESFENIIEKIDIGGPAMARSAAKNFKYSTVITSPQDYSALVDELSNNHFSTTLEFRKKCAIKTFSLTAYYDAVIANWFKGQDRELSGLLTIPLKKQLDLRYGENPHQKGAFYEIPLSGDSLARIKKLQGKELSYNNLSDMETALEITSTFQNAPCVAVIKHSTPCGIACANTIEEAYLEALNADRRSAFGGVVSINRPIQGELAALIKEHFYEVVMAPSFSLEALQILSKKTNLRLIEAVPYGSLQGVKLKNVKGGVLIQETDSFEINESNFELVAGNIKNIPIEYIIFSFNIVKFFKSNAIVITQGTKLVAFGSGQTSRIDSMEIACKKLAVSEANLEDCILSSDAFFPFTDNLEIAKKFGIKTIIAPSGSIKDSEIKEFAKTQGLNLLFAKTRHFSH